MFSWHNDLYLALAQRFIKAQLHHGLMLCADQGAGKEAFSNQLAQTILCQQRQANTCGQCQSCKLFEAGSHPDFIQLFPEKTIGIDAVRQAIQTLTGKAYMSGSQVLVIHQAHLMTLSAANALLKTLEEPTSGTYLLLLTESPQQLLPTVLSRVEKVTLAHPSNTELLYWLSEEGFDSVDSEMLSLYQNAPNKLLEILKDSDSLTFDVFQQKLIALSQHQESAKVLADQWQIQSVQIVTWLQHWLKLNARQNVLSDELWILYNQCVEVKAKLANPGVNKQLQLANLLTSIQSIKLN
jgi:DNA polymerase-3 subunit delta'